MNILIPSLFYINIYLEKNNTLIYNLNLTKNEYISKTLLIIS